MGKSVLIGGSAAGILSIFPLLNLLNLFFMFWIVLGSGLTVFLLSKDSQQLGKIDALLAGAFSGLIGGGIFAVFSLISIMGISQEQLEQMVEKAKAITPALRENISRTLPSGQFKTIMIISICLFVFLAIMAGAVSGLIARRIFNHPLKNVHE
jgi:hypothetical protein